jgi:hypothetical protein
MATLVPDTGQYQGVTREQLTGDQFLNTLPPNVQPLIKSYAAGKMPISPMMVRTPAGSSLLQAINQYDPSFDTTNFNARHDTAQDFSTKGKSGQNIVAIETLMHHLDTAEKDYKELHNTAFPALNWAINPIEAQVFGNKRMQAGLKNVKEDSNAIAGEMAKVFRSTGMSEADINSWKDNFTTNLSPTEQHAAIKKAVELVSGRMEPVVSSYNKVMGSQKNIGDFMTDPKAKATYQRLYGENINYVPNDSAKPNVQTNPPKTIRFEDLP